MTHLVEVADIIPNLTEASMLLGERYPDYLTAMQAEAGYLVFVKKYVFRL